MTRWDNGSDATILKEASNEENPAVYCCRISGGPFVPIYLPHASVLAQSVVDPKVPTNQRFVLEDEAHNSVGDLSFDASGIPVIELTGHFGKSLRGHVFRILCEIRPFPRSAVPEK